MLTLIQLSYSPWSEKARWALEHHRLDYRRMEYLPIFGEPLLRTRTRRFRGRITVPILLAGRRVVSDSLEIARHADQHGEGEPLFPAGREREIQDWNDQSERLLGAGRARTTARVGRSKEAKRESIPPWLRRLGPVGDGIANLGVRYLSRKYRLTDEGEEAHARVMEQVLETIEEVLGTGRRYLLDEFSFADIAIASALQFVKPVDDQHIKLGPASRREWTEPALAERFRDVLAWRDQVYEEHR